MPLLPGNQKDQLKLFAGLVAVSLAAYYYLYPYTMRAEELTGIDTHVTQLDSINQRAKAELAKGSVDELRAQAAQYRANLEQMRRLVPTGNEVPALLEQISTAARRVGLEVGNVTPEPMIAGEQFDTYRYKLTVVGGYHALAEFLTNVGSLPRIVAPVTFSLVPGDHERSGQAARRHAGRRARVDGDHPDVRRPRRRARGRAHAGERRPTRLRGGRPVTHPATHLPMRRTPVPSHGPSRAPRR
jgi:type IV pilus assembly protein PilO